MQVRGQRIHHHDFLFLGANQTCHRRGEETRGRASRDVHLGNGHAHRDFARRPTPPRCSRAYELAAAPRNSRRGIFLAGLQRREGNETAPDIQRGRRLGPMIWQIQGSAEIWASVFIANSLNLRKQDGTARSSIHFPICDLQI